MITALKGHYAVTKITSRQNMFAIVLVVAHRPECVSFISLYLLLSPV